MLHFRKCCSSGHGRNSTKVSLVKIVHKFCLSSLFMIFNSWTVICICTMLSALNVTMHWYNLGSKLIRTQCGLSWSKVIKLYTSQAARWICTAGNSEWRATGRCKSHYHPISLSFSLSLINFWVQDLLNFVKYVCKAYKGSYVPEACKPLPPAARANNADKARNLDIIRGNWELGAEPFEAKTIEEHKKEHGDFKNFLKNLNCRIINPLKIYSVTRYELELENTIALVLKNGEH